MRRAPVVLALLALTAVAGCASIAPRSGPQPASYGITVTWDQTAPGSTAAAELALGRSCGLSAPTQQGARAGAGYVQTTYATPGRVLPPTLASCLTASALVTLVDVLGGPPGSGR